mgnify:CR=1 FL=1
MQKKIYYISRNYRSSYDAAGKAKIDCENIFSSLEFQNLGFQRTTIAKAYGTLLSFLSIGFALIRLPYKSVLITQYPNSKFRILILWMAKLKACKIVTVVHDIRTLKKADKKKKNELKYIVTDVIIVHNKVMQSWFIQQGVKSAIFVLNIFDYLVEELPTQNKTAAIEDRYKIVYAGGISPKKNPFLYDLDSLITEQFSLNLYGKGFDESKLSFSNTILDYKGMFPSDAIPYKIVGNFGLVWDGDSLNECSGILGEYLRFNNPHKTSLYLASGLPVIIWKDAALAPFIIVNKLGIAIENFKELEEQLANMKSADYKALKRNVERFQSKITTGYFLTEAIRKSLEILAKN